MGTSDLTYNLADTAPQKRSLIMEPFDVLVVGAGLSGSVIAERHAKRGDRVLVIERRSSVGGNCYDFIDDRTGILVHKYGAHLFHTNNEIVWQYINQFSRWKRFDHFVLGFVDNTYIPVGMDLYLKIFKPYTEKQWETNASNLDASVTARIPVRNNFDNLYFSDRYQASPGKG